MEKADELLGLFPEIRVKELAARCGYEDPLYFSRVYKKQRGLSPFPLGVRLRPSQTRLPVPRGPTGDRPARARPEFPSPRRSRISRRRAGRSRRYRLDRPAWCLWASNRRGGMPVAGCQILQAEASRWISRRSRLGRLLEVDLSVAGHATEDDAVLGASEGPGVLNTCSAGRPVFSAACVAERSARSTS